MATIDQDLRDMEESIRKLKMEYDQFFVGVVATPPTDFHKKVDQIVKRIGNANMGSVDRFRYTTLLSRWNSYTELWGRQMRVKEEGPRQRSASTRAASSLPTVPVPVVISDPATDREAMQRLYDSYVAARRRSGLDDTKTGVPAFDSFARTIAKQTQQLRERTHCGAIEFRVEVKEGKVALKAKAKGGDGSPEGGA